MTTEIVQERASKIPSKLLKQEPRTPRLKAMRSDRSLFFGMIRATAMVGMAVLLILVLLPAALAAQAAGS